MIKSIGKNSLDLLIFTLNFLLKAELVALRHDLVEERAAKQVLEKEVNNLLLQLHAVQLQLHSNAGMPLDSDDSRGSWNRLVRQELQESCPPLELENASR